MAGGCQTEQFIKLLDQLIPCYFLLTHSCVCFYCCHKDVITAPNCSFLLYLVCYQRPYFSLPILAENFMIHGRNFACKTPVSILNGFRGIRHSSGAFLLVSNYWIGQPVIIHDVMQFFTGCDFSLLTHGSLSLFYVAGVCPVNCHG